ncbi:14407_t:CDS:2 [Cetraspora pellucida]|uniref:14407_t:CDS:1 n=1 Tax=Cetraspora pellucida TaxID=1433469 RepID=A0A9N9I424_9GLOM|nr:14407_t:CDS:2 [Cetraspora pellucida]
MIINEIIEISNEETIEVDIEMNKIISEMIYQFINNVKESSESIYGTFLSGVATALDTLCSQAYTPAEQILVLIGQDPGIAAQAGLYLRYLLVGAPALLLLENLKKYLHAQGIMKASTYVSIICFLINVCLTFTLVLYQPLSLDLIGAPISTAVLTLAIPGILMVCSEWIFEFISLRAGYFGGLSLASQITARIENLLGAGLVERAKMASKISMQLNVIVALLNTTVLIVFKDYWDIFISEEDVVKLTSYVLLLAGLFQFGRSWAWCVSHRSWILHCRLSIDILLAFRLGFRLQGLWIGKMEN